MIALAAGTIATAASITFGAGIRFHIPGSAVPITGQTAAVCLCAVFIGRASATLGAMLYALLAILGLPVLAGFSSRVHKPSFGYVIGFAATAYIAAPTDAVPSPWDVLARCALGQLSCLGVGACWLSAVSGMSIEQSWSDGIRPLLPGLAIKSLFVTAAAALRSSAGDAVFAASMCAAAASALGVSQWQAQRAAKQPRLILWDRAWVVEELASAAIFVLIVYCLFVCVS